MSKETPDPSGDSKEPSAPPDSPLSRLDNNLKLLSSIWERAKKLGIEVWAVVLAVSMLLLGKTTSVFATWPMRHIVGFVVFFGALGVLVIIWGICNYKRRLRHLLVSLMCGFACWGVASLVVYMMPPAPKWDVQPVPYEATSSGDSILALVGSELPPAGFPGTSSFENLLDERTGDSEFLLRYKIFVSSDITPNRLPSELRVNTPADYAIAAYLFGKAGNMSHWTVTRHGFASVGDFVSLESTATDPIMFRVAVVLFPLNAEAANVLERTTHLEEICGIK